MYKHANDVLKTETLMLDKSKNSGKLIETDHVYLKRTAALIKDWVDEGRITYRCMGYAKARMALDKIERETKRQEWLHEPLARSKSETVVKMVFEVQFG